LSASEVKFCAADSRAAVEKRNNVLDQNSKFIILKHIVNVYVDFQNMFKNKRVFGKYIYIFTQDNP
jgi:hypothetical protein